MPVSSALHTSRAGSLAVPFDYETASADDGWRERLAWPTPYHVIYETGLEVSRSLVEVLRSFQGDAALDAALLAAPAIVSSTFPLAEAALLARDEQHASIRLFGKIPELDYLRGGPPISERPPPRGMTAFYPPAAPRGILLRRIARMRSWTPLARLPATLLAPEAVAISHNALLRDFAERSPTRLGFHHAEVLFGAARRLTPAPVVGFDVREPARRIAQALSRVDGIDAATRERLARLIEDQAVCLLEEAARDVARMRHLRRLPDHLWSGTGTYWPTRALSLEVLRRGGRITRFDHGGGTGVNLLQEVWNVTDLSVCTRYVVPTETIAARIRRSGVLTRLPIGQAVDVLGHSGDPLIRRTAARPCRTGQGRRRVLYTPLPLLGFRQVVPAYLPDLVNLDWQLRLAAMLKTLPVDFTCRPHPEGLLKGRPHPVAGIVEPSPRRFEELVEETDLFVFDYVQSTTFYEALCTDRPIVLLDMGAPIFDAELRATLERRCRVVPVAFDDRNLPRLDEAALRDAVCGGSDVADPGEFRSLLLET